MTKTYKLPMSLEDWQCYLDTPQEVVDLINTSCQRALDASQDPHTGLRRVYMVLNDFVEFGLRDTECDHVAVAVVMHTSKINLMSIGTLLVSFEHHYLTPSAFCFYIANVGTIPSKQHDPTLLAHQ